MKSSHPLFQTALRSSLAAVSFWITLAGLAYAYAAFSPLSPVNANDPLSASAWNLMVANLNDLNSKTVPTGGVMAFFGTSCPAGWSAADGTANGVKRTDGTSGTLDLRGEFIRGLDGGRGADSGRTLGSAQGSSENRLNRITTVTGNNSGLRDVTIPADGSASDNLLMDGYLTTYGYGAMKFYNTGNETRPRNVALLYCVKN